ncbi:hypothetical protein VNO78_17504 [Psophocarpus tetragonolobus]|uniref:Uncharacterized protein n=1 Tax=Psophocarpus tetragonolobus TaxID=3891 RepID=A0AAN9SHW3_PSOTE
MELLWQNGKVVMQSQNHRSLRKPPLTEIPPLLDNFNNHLFMPFDHTFPLDFLYSPPSAPATPRPPIPPSQPNFASFSSHNTRAADLSVMTAARDSTVVDSCHTPAEGFVGAPAPSTTGAGGRTTMMCDLTMTSSPEASSNSDEPVHVAPPDDRKRKGREAHEWECQSEGNHATGEGERSQYELYYSNSRLKIMMKIGLVMIGLAHHAMHLVKFSFRGNH